MHTKYDRSVDALAITLRPGATSHRTVRVTELVRVDLDAEGRAIGVELLDASWHMRPEDLAHLPSASVEFTLSEAAAESGLSTETLRGQINKGRIKARKRGRDWIVDATSLTNYLESREARGRPAKNPKARRPPRRASGAGARRKVGS
jgi:uncharacterized protein YuzE